MSLKEQIDAAIKTAMLARNKEELDALRSIKSMILLPETEKGASGEVGTDAELKLLMRAAKQRKESADVFRENGRPELADKEEFQLEIINKYLPKQLSEEEVAAVLKEIIAQTNSSGPKDMGKVMGAATKKLAGKADGKMISELVKKLLTT